MSLLQPGQFDGNHFLDFTLHRMTSDVNELNHGTRDLYGRFLIVGVAGGTRTIG